MSCRFLGAKAEELGVEIYPGFAATEVLYGDKGEVLGIATGDMGVGRDGEPKDSFTRGMELRGKYTLFAEGARGSLTKQVIARFGLDQGREPQKYGIGIKELWRIDPAKHQAGPRAALLRLAALVATPAAAPSSITIEDNQVVVGFVIHLNYKNPTLSPFDEFQRFKTHPMVARHLRGRQAAGLWRPRADRRRLAIRAQARLPRRRADRLRGGLHECPAHQRLA